MRLIGKIALGVALSLALLSAREASAATICSGCGYLGSASYLGSLNPNNDDNSSFTHNSIPAGALSDEWVFDLNPGGATSLNATFLPTNAISNFNVQLFQVLASVCTALSGSPATNATGCTLTTVSATNLITNTGSGNIFNVNPTNLGAGRYVFRVTGTVTNQPGAELYSGNVNAFVPEPASIALMGMGLAAAAVAMRRRQRA